MSIENGGDCVLSKPPSWSIDRPPVGEKDERRDMPK